MKTFTHFCVPAVLIWLLAVGAIAEIRAATNYPPGFTWRRAADWTIRPDADHNTTNGNPDDDALGHPVWSYEYVTGGALGSATPWYAQPATLLWWDQSWFGGGGLWARSDDVSPPIDVRALIHVVDGAVWDYVPLVRWFNPSDHAEALAITGSLAVRWSGSGDVGSANDVEVVLALKRQSTGNNIILFSRTVSKPTPGENAGESVLLPVNLPSVVVNVADQIIITHRSRSAVASRWNVLYDDLTFTTLPATNEPPLILAGPASTNVLPGATVTLRVFAVGPAPLSYQWFFRGTNLAGETGTNYTVAFAQSAQSGPYTVVVSNPFGATTSSVANLTVEYCTPRPSGLVSWWTGDGVALDLAGTNHGTLQNGAIFGPGTAGRSFSFDGVDDRISIPESFSIDLSRSTRWTIEAWVNPADFTNPWPTIYSEGNWGASLGLRNGTGVPESWINNADRLNGTVALSLNQWAHIALVYDGTNRIFYVNGAFAGAGNAPAILSDSTGSAIGDVVPSNSSAHFNGFIDEPAIYNRALASNEIAALYAAGSAGKCFTNDPAPVFVLQPASQTGYFLNKVTFTGLAMGTPRTDYQWRFNGAPIPAATNNTLILSNLTLSHAGSYVLVASNQFGVVQSAPASLAVDYCAPRPAGLVAWWTGDGTTLDAAGGNHAALVNGAGYGPGRAGQSFSLAGTTGYVQAPDHPSLDFGTTSFTAECWIYVPPGVLANNTEYGVVNKNATYQGTPGWGIELSTYGRYPNYDLRFYNTGQPSWCSTCTGFVPMLPGRWYHLAAVRSDTNASLYVDGELQSAVTDSNVARNVDNSQPLLIGRHSWGPSFPGQIDEVSLYNRALTPGEIATLHATGSAGKCFTNDPAPVFAIHPADQTGFLFNSVTLTGLAIGAPRPDYQWLFNGSPIPGATNAMLVLNNLGATNAGQYVLVASNRFGFVQSQTAILSVVPQTILTGIESFELGWNGWTSDSWVWQVGFPTSGPGRAHCGTNVAATVLDGNYPDGADCRLASSWFVVPPTVQNPRFRFWHWFNFSHWTVWQWRDGGLDFGEVQIREVGGPWRTLARYDNDSSAVWCRAGFDLNPYSEKTVQVSFHLLSAWPHTAPGWYVDDVTVETGPVQSLPEDFEAGIGDWYVEGGTWEVGEPTYGPAANPSGSRARSGTNCAATVLNGNYSDDIASRLVSPVFTVPGPSENPRLRFWHWFNFSHWTVWQWRDGGVDFGQVQIREPGGSWQTLARYDNDSSGVWSKAGFNLAEYADKAVQVGFYFESHHLRDAWDGWYQNSAPGWYVDDVTVETGPVQSLPEDFEAGIGDWYVEGGTWEVGEPTYGPAANPSGSRARSGTNCAATVLNGDYSDDIASRLVSPVFTVPGPSENPRLRFWHWFNFSHWTVWQWRDGGVDFGQVQIREPGGSWQTLARYDNDSSGVWSKAGFNLAEYADKAVQVGFYFESHHLRDAWDGWYQNSAPGWYVDDVTVETGPVQSLPEDFEAGIGDWYVEGGTWEVGEPTYGPAANPSGSRARSGTNCAATVLNGNYSDDIASRLVSPVFTVPGPSENPRLRFWHWFSFNGGVSGGDYGEVHFRVGRGAWQLLTNFAGDSSGTWARSTLDLPVQRGQQVQVGFSLLSHHYTDPWDGWYPNVSPGWYLDDLELKTGPDILKNPETFESGWGDWDTDNYALWQIGVPTAGPPVNTNTGSRALSPVSVAATLLSANYPASSQGRLISPRFIVPSVSGDARVIFRFWQYYEYGSGDAGLVQIQTPYEANWTTVAVAATNGMSGSWTLATVDLTPYQGQEIRVGFLHTANGDGSVGAGWFLDDVSLSQSVPTRLALDTPSTQRFTANRQGQYFVVTVPAGGHLRVMLDALAALGINEVYVRRGALPSPGAYDFRYNVNGGTDQSIFVPNAGAGDWFILAYNDSGPVPGDYTLEVEFKTGVILDSLAPARVGNAVPGAITIHGAGFTPSDTVALVGGGTYPATAVSFVSASELVADFNFPLVPTNTYQLTVISGTNSDALPITVTDGGAPRLETEIHVPGSVGYHAIATIYVEYRNVGQVAMSSPLLTVAAEQLGRKGALLSLDASRLVQGFWTASVPEGFAHSVQFLGNGATPGILQPGESKCVPVYYAGWQQPWDFGYRPISFRLGIVTDTNRTPMAWPALKADTKPGTVSAEAWDAIFANFTNQVGGTWGDYVRMLNDNAGYLARLGENVNDIRELFGFEMQQASGLDVLRTLASAIDAQVAAPGPALLFRRDFSTGIADRYRLGRLGRGWSDNWDIGLTNAPDGTVSILGPGRSRRVFQPDSRNSNYFGQPGDIASLTNLGGGRYVLRENDGTRHAFRSDGKLDCMEDTHGIRINAVYSGNQLSRLVHSTGPFLQFAYNGDLIASIMDSLGRTNTFAYDGEHLASARNYRGEETRYSYEMSLLTSAATHALKEVVNPDGVRQTFTYDAFGRLSSRAGCCGSLEQTTYAYPSAGLVIVTDTLTNTTKSYFDHRGLVLRTEDPLGHVTQRTFDDNGQIMRTTDPAGRTRAYSYDSRGDRIGETDQLGNTTRFVRTPALNKLGTLIDAKGNVTTYAYEPDGDPASITYADGGRESWSNDSRGLRVSWTNRRGQTVRYTNDPAGRVTERVYPDGSLVTFRYDARGNLTNFTDVTGSTTQEFDSNDRLTRIIYPANRILGYTYDTGGRRTSMTNELGHRTDYHYDERGRLWYLTDERGSNIVTYAYDAAGWLSLKMLGNGMYTVNTYDPAGQLLDLHNRKPDGSTLSRFQYTYDSRGRRTTMTTSYGSGDPRTSISGLWRYDYDDSGQLIGWTAPDGRRVDYRYDALGNRLIVMDGGVPTEYAVNNLNQYMRVGSTILQYDADGNLTNKVAAEGTTRFAWSFDNKLLQAAAPSGLSQMMYNSLGDRTRIVEDGAVMDFVSDPSGLGNVVGEYDSGLSLVAEYHHGIGLVSRRRSDGTYGFYSFDALGSTTEFAMDSGTVSNVYTFLPFGELLLARETIGNSFQFVGESGVMAVASRVNFMRARHYEPHWGRFVSADPIGILGGDLNFYRYAINDPVRFSDPSGLESGCDPNNPQTAEAIRYCARKRGRWACGYKNGHCDACWCLDGWPDNPPPPDLCDQDPKICDDYCFLYPDNCKDGRPIRPNDPNELSGPGGYGPRNFVTSGSLLPYTIHFENATNATAPAQQVFLTDPLTNLFDGQTFELTEIAFGDVFLAVPPGTRHFEKSVPMRFNGVDFEVQVEAGIRGVGQASSLSPRGGAGGTPTLLSFEVYATFRSIIPTSGLPPGVETGFLPPENGTGRGQGHIGYVIRAHTNLTTGTEIRNVAFITFDIQPAIRTDQVDPHNPAAGIDTNKQALVTIDADAPTSLVHPLPATTPSARFNVAWSGSDVGAGITGFDVYVRTNGGPGVLWLVNTPAASATFLGRNNTPYCFYVIARDGTGQVQPTNTATFVCTTTPPNSPPWFLPPLPTNYFVISVNQTLSVTNAATDPDDSAQTLTFSLGNPPAGASINAGSGVFRWTPACWQGNSTNTITFVVTDNGLPSPLSATTNITVLVRECIEASLGNTVMLAGTSSNVPIRLLSTVELTNLFFSVGYPPARFTNFTLTVDTQQVSAPLLLESNGLVHIALTLPANRVLYGPTNVGELCFSSLANQSSDFVTLVITNIDGLKPNGSSVANAYGYPGRVVVVGDQQLLEASLGTNGQREGIIYARTPGTNVLQYVTSIVDTNWQDGWEVIQTNLVTRFRGVATNLPAIYLRARQKGQ